MNDLSRLLSGELPPAEEAALRARIAADPELAARWSRMQALPGLLTRLPAELPGAPRLREAPAPAVEPPRRRSLAVVAAAGWLAAAALTLAVLLPPPERILVQGSEFVDGSARVVAGGVPIDIDGRALVRVEPPAAGRREVGAEVNMTGSHLLAAAAGSIVTITVYEGIARIHADGAPIQEVHPGETVVAGEAEDAAQAPARRKRDDPDTRIARLEAENARLRAERARLVAASPGVKKSAWPAEVPEDYRREGFDRRLADALAPMPDVEVLASDCSEYPCVALLESHSTEAGWEDELRGLPGEFGEGSAMAMAHEVGTPDGDLRLYGFAPLPPGLSEEAQGRVQQRLQALLKEEAGGPE